MIDNAKLEPAFETVRTSFPHAKPAMGMILGSGWSDAATGFDIHGSLSYADIPAIGASGVAGHAGKLLHASRAGVEVFIFQGRRHYYEVMDFHPIAAPLYLLKRFGATSVLLTNAAGGVRKDWAPGDLMLMEDHINMMGVNPLLGLHNPFWGTRFPDQSRVYDKTLRALLEKAAAAANLPLRHGVYLAGTGPTYETPAEVRAWRALGADAVGMSTVPEAILANAAGLQVLGLSCITNMASGILDQPLTHNEVTATTQHAMANMKALLLAYVDQFATAHR